MDGVSAFWSREQMHFLRAAILNPLGGRIFN